MPMAGDPGVAFGMTIGAGMCTTLGAALAFCVPIENKRFLAVSLGIAAGVMVYVSLVEIFFKSLGALSDEWCPEREVGELCPKAYGATTGFFFAGLALCACLNALTHNLEAIVAFVRNGFVPVPQQKSIQGGDAGGRSRETAMKERFDSKHSDGDRSSDHGSTSALMPSLAHEAADPIPRGWVVAIARSCGRPFFTNVHTGARAWSLPRMDGLSHEAIGIQVTSQPVLLGARAGVLGGLPAAFDSRSAFGSRAAAGNDVERGAAGGSSDDGAEGEVEVDRKQLQMTGLLTGIAIAIHNFPEGLATFVAAMADPSLGAAIAVAIAIHNIPEGVCVAMPVFYATGSKLRAFMWATLSGVSEPIGALFGWAVLAGDVSNMAYGAMFGLVAGMMIYISLAELLPSAYRHDTNPVVVTVALVSGMMAMALSLVLFVVV
uniref:WW domain-containing protein n=1 Tax=Hemiselmis andersenii TaxID=464988 RepID=A0A6U4XLV5_HEMAN